MNATTRLSAKGQIVIPKEVRDSHAWAPGTTFDVIDRPDGILLRPAQPPAQSISWEEFRARNPAHDGPPIPESEWAEGIAQMFRETWSK